MYKKYFIYTIKYNKAFKLSCFEKRPTLILSNSFRYKNVQIDQHEGRITKDGFNPGKYKNTYITWVFITLAG